MGGFGNLVLCPPRLVKTPPTIFRKLSGVLFAALLGLLTVNAANAQIYVLDFNSNNAVEEFNAGTGAVINASVVPILYPQGIALSGNNLYVMNGAGTISKYNATTDAVINPSLVSGLVYGAEIAVSGNNLYVAYSTGPSGGTIINTIGVYNATTGVAINPTFTSVPGGNLKVYFALSGDDLYVANGTITEYNATSGAVINSSIGAGSGAYGSIGISGNNLYVEASDGVDEYNATTGALIKSALVALYQNMGPLAVSGGDLFVSNDENGTVDKYNATTGVLIKTGLISGFNLPGLLLALNVPPAITSTASATFTTTELGGFTVTATGTPAPTFSATRLPSWATLNASTGVLSGTPPDTITTTTAFTVNLTATNGVTPSATQTFTLTVQPLETPPAITSAPTTTFAVGQLGSFFVTATGYPAPTFSATGLPNWVSSNPTTGVLSGNPTDTTGAPFTITITASNGNSPNATQTFTLNVEPLQTFNQWEVSENFTGDPSTTGPTATPFNDGVTNKEKYFYDIDPSAPMSTTDRAALPVLGTVTVNGTQYLTLTYRENPTETGIIVTPQSSSEMQIWADTSFTQIGNDPTNGDPIMQVQVPVRDTAQYLRLNLVIP